jgi:hypothetical protein
MTQMRLANVFKVLFHFTSTIFAVLIFGWVKMYTQICPAKKMCFEKPLRSDSVGSCGTVVNLEAIARIDSAHLQIAPYLLADSVRVIRCVVQKCWLRAKVKFIANYV